MNFKVFSTGSQETDVLFSLSIHTRLARTVNRGASCLSFCSLLVQARPPTIPEAVRQKRERGGKRRKLVSVAEPRTFVVAALYMRSYIDKCIPQVEMIACVTDFDCTATWAATCYRKRIIAILWGVGGCYKVLLKELIAEDRPHITVQHIIIIIMETCKRPTYQKILTAQGPYKSKNSDNVLQHKI